MGVKSNKAGIGAKIRVTAAGATSLMRDGKALVQVEEVRSGGSYYSQNDLRVHFGLDGAVKADLIEIEWPSGHKDTWKDLPANALYVLEEGGKVLKTMAMGAKLA